MNELIDLFAREPWLLGVLGIAVVLVLFGGHYLHGVWLHGRQQEFESD